MVTVVVRTLCDEVHPSPQFYQSEYFVLSSAVERKRKHVEHVLAAPTLGIGIVLHRAHAPFGVAGHGVGGNSPQKANVLDRTGAAAASAVDPGLVALPPVPVAPTMSQTASRQKQTANRQAVPTAAGTAAGAAKPYPRRSPAYQIGRIAFRAGLHADQLGSAASL